MNRILTDVIVLCLSCGLAAQPCVADLTPLLAGSVILHPSLHTSQFGTEALGLASVVSRRLLRIREALVGALYKAGIVQGLMRLIRRSQNREAVLAIGSGRPSELNVDVFVRELTDLANARFRSDRVLKTYSDTASGQEVNMIYVLPDSYYLTRRSSNSMPVRVQGTAIPIDLAQALPHPGAGYDDSLGVDARVLRDPVTQAEMARFCRPLAEILIRERAYYGHRIDIEQETRIAMEYGAITLLIHLPAYVRGAVRQGQQPVLNGQRPVLLSIIRTEDIPPGTARRPTMSAPDAGAVRKFLANHSFSEFRRADGRAAGAQYRVFTHPQADFLLKVPLTKDETRAVLMKRWKAGAHEYSLKKWVQQVHQGKSAGIDLERGILATSQGVYHVTPLQNVTLGGKVYPVVYAQRVATQTMLSTLAQLAQAGEEEGLKSVIKAYIQLQETELWPFGVFDLDEAFTANCGVEWSGGVPWVALFDIGMLTTFRRWNDVLTIPMLKPDYWKSAWVLFAQARHHSMLTLTGLAAFTDWAALVLSDAFAPEHISFHWNYRRSFA